MKRGLSLLQHAEASRGLYHFIEVVVLVPHGVPFQRRMESVHWKRDGHTADLVGLDQLVSGDDPVADLARGGTFNAFSFYRHIPMWTRPMSTSSIVLSRRRS